MPSDRSARLTPRPDVQAHEEVLRLARHYTDIGLRIWPLPCNSKAPQRRGFSAEFPEATWPPEQFEYGDRIAILMGPQSPSADHDLTAWAQGRWLCGLDLDGTLTRAMLSEQLGGLTDTLSSKGQRHLYYWITPEQRARGALHQQNDVFKTKLARGFALDLRPAAGGYFLEVGNWDAPATQFDPHLIADLPNEAHSRLLAFGRRKRGRPIAPCKFNYNDFGSGEVTPFGLVPTKDREALARALAAVWPRPGQGGGHNLAFALGGVLASVQGGINELVDFACRVYELAQAPKPAAEVELSLSNRRLGVDAAVRGWPSLRTDLLAANSSAIGRTQVMLALNAMQKTLPGLALKHATALGAQKKTPQAELPGGSTPNQTETEGN
jgi:hypothetical protein